MAGRNTLAKALRMWRKGAGIEAIADAIGVKRQSICGFMLQSRAYRRNVKRRRNASKWHEIEGERNARSKMFRVEAIFREHAAKAFEDHGFTVRQEVVIPGTRRRIDLVVESGIFRFGVELKNGNRTARLDQTLGQAIVKCNALGGIIPVCAVPDDVMCDKVFLSGCLSIGAIAGTVTQCLSEICVRCCK